MLLCTKDTKRNKRDNYRAVWLSVVVEVHRDGATDSDHWDGFGEHQGKINTS